MIVDHADGCAEKTTPEYIIWGAQDVGLRDFRLQICRAVLAQHFPGEDAIAETLGIIKFA